MTPGKKNPIWQATMSRGLTLWREHAVAIVTNPSAYTPSQCRLAWRYLKQWGAK